MAITRIRNFVADRDASPPVKISADGVDQELDQLVSSVNTAETNTATNVADIATNVTNIAAGVANDAVQDTRMDVAHNADGTQKVGIGAVGIDFAISGDVPTFVSAGAFTVPGDRTATYTKGRRLQIDSSVYSTVLSSVFTTLTTITVEEGNIPSGIASVDFGITSTGSTGSAPKDQQVVTNFNAIEDLANRLSLLEASANPGLNPQDFFADNTQTDLTATTMDTANASGQKDINVASTVGFAVGDSIDLVDALDFTIFETVEITSITAGVKLRAVTTLVNSYINGSDVKRTSSVIQGGLQKLPTKIIDSATTLLLHMDGADASTTFVDEAGHTMTAVGNAHLDTAIKVFGTASGLFDGASDHLTTPDHADWDLASEFTIDLRIRFNSVAGTQEFLSHDSAGVGWQFRIEPGKLGFAKDNGISLGVGVNWTPLINTQYHIAVVKNSSNVWRFFVDGVQIGVDITNAVVFTEQSTVLSIGSQATGSGSVNGRMDEFRFSNGLARWSSNFTPPNRQYPIQVKKANYRSIVISRPQRMISKIILFVRQSLSVFHTGITSNIGQDRFSGISPVGDASLKYAIGDLVVFRDSLGFYVKKLDGNVFVGTVSAVDGVAGTIDVAENIPSAENGAQLERCDIKTRASIVATGGNEAMVAMDLRVVEQEPGSNDLLFEWHQVPSVNGQDANIELALSTTDPAIRDNVYAVDYTSLLEFL